MRRMKRRCCCAGPTLALLHPTENSWQQNEKPPSLVISAELEASHFLVDVDCIRDF
jgi:hypothetical protein